MKIKTLIFLAIMTFGWILGASVVMAADVSEGRTLYMAEKYKCYTCHGEKGEGGKGPAFIGIGKKLTTPDLIKAAAHMCPPTGACSPHDIEAIAGYLRTL
jgi:mono/diheme cytochrome c family protein